MKYLYVAITNSFQIYEDTMYGVPYPTSRTKIVKIPLIKEQEMMLEITKQEVLSILAIQDE